jgi:hypothetical protein
LGFMSCWVMAVASCLFRSVPSTVYRASKQQELTYASLTGFNLRLNGCVSRQDDQGKFNFDQNTLINPVTGEKVSVCTEKVPSEQRY